MVQIKYNWIIGFCLQNFVQGAGNDFKEDEVQHVLIQYPSKLSTGINLFRNVFIACSSSRGPHCEVMAIGPAPASLIDEVTAAR